MIDFPFLVKVAIFGKFRQTDNFKTCKVVAQDDEFATIVVVVRAKDFNLYPLAWLALQLALESFMGIDQQQTIFVQSARDGAIVLPYQREVRIAWRVNQDVRPTSIYTDFEVDKDWLVPYSYLNADLAE